METNLKNLEKAAAHLGTLMSMSGTMESLLASPVSSRNMVRKASGLGSSVTGLRFMDLHGSKKLEHWSIFLYFPAQFRDVKT